MEDKLNLRSLWTLLKEKITVAQAEAGANHTMLLDDLYTLQSSILELLQQPLLNMSSVQAQLRDVLTCRQVVDEGEDPLAMEPVGPELVPDGPQELALP